MSDNSKRPTALDAPLNGDDVEKVARAIALAEMNTHDSGTPPKWSDWRDHAVAAIGALDLPTRDARIAEEREACAKAADERSEQFAADGLKHPENSEARARCFARARAAAYVAMDIRERKLTR
jgi:hypothetical protein